MKWPWQRKEPPSDEVLEIEKSLQQTKILIAQAYAGFNSAADQELVESYVYEIQALQARYSYLLRQRKAWGEAAGGEKTASRPVRAVSGGGRVPPRPLPSRAAPQKAVATEQPHVEEGPVAPILPVA